MPDSKRTIGFYFLWALVALIFLWTPFSYPLRLLITLVHELGHLTAVSLTGGEVYEIAVKPGGSGHVIRDGGWHGLIHSAGYMGTLLVATFLFWCSARLDTSRLGLGAIAILLAVYMVIAARSFGVLVSFVFLAFFFTFVIWSCWPVLQFAVTRLLAICMAIEGTADIYHIMFSFDRVRQQSVWEPVSRMPEATDFYTDATLMAARYGGTEGGWALVWMAVSLLCLTLGIIWSVRAEIENEVELKQKTKVHPGFSFKRGEGREYRVR